MRYDHIAINGKTKIADKFDDKSNLWVRLLIINQFNCQDDIASKQYKINCVLENLLIPKTFEPYKK